MGTGKERNEMIDLEKIRARAHELPKLFAEGQALAEQQRDLILALTESLATLGTLGGVAPARAKPGPKPGAKASKAVKGKAKANGKRRRPRAAGREHIADAIKRATSGRKVSATEVIKALATFKKGSVYSYLSKLSQPNGPVRREGPSGAYTYTWEGD